MLPSILAAEVRDSTRHFLVAANEAADPFFHGVMQRFVDRPDGLYKGPYLQVGLPFRAGREGRGFFGSFELPHPGYAHQEAAWRRLASDRAAANTLVATGTGSGKTECFLYPLLDHCRRLRAAGGAAAGGIKALVIYPMNALAGDQARRFAEVIAGMPAFAGLRVGLYVGGGGRDGAQQRMGPTQVITDRDALRKAPPDVLLTNYKMLDYLLLRPKDRALWAANGPETLRYVVVDELHTFDGAQGTDLSLLLRRLKARLGTPAGGLIGVGTSATLGDGNGAQLCEYATQVFGTPFAAESVVTESRDSVAEFLGDQPIEHFMAAPPDLARVLDPAAHASPEAAIAAWFGVCFPGLPVPADVRDAAWRQALGGWLKQHLLLHNLLRLLKGGVAPLPTLTEKLTGSLPQAARAHADRVLDAFLALLAWARQAQNPALPLVTLRVQLWLRELRRMVANVSADPAAVTLRLEAELKASQSGQGRAAPPQLPLVQCTDCRTTGWLGLRANASSKFVQDPDIGALYNAWFRGAPEVLRLYPVDGIAGAPPAARRVHACGHCGELQDAAGECRVCGHPQTVAVWELRGQRQSESGGTVYNWHDKVCPACGSRDRLLLVGARSATLAAQIIEQAWASPYNDDKKLIAFSDSVQDAAHRAGFFGARTWKNNARMAISQVIAREAQPRMAWTALLERLPAYWRRERGLTPEQFVTEFIGPNMQWQQEWTQLQVDRRIAAEAPLLDRVGKRLAWQAVADFTYESTRGRTLERVGVATLAPRAEAVEAVTAELGGLLAERLGLRGLDATLLRQWLWGFLLKLRGRGAVTHPAMEGYFREGNFFAFSQRSGRALWLPGMTTWGPRPLFLGLDDSRHADRLVSRNNVPTWFQNWLKVTLGRAQLMPKGIEPEAYGLAVELLVREGVLAVASGSQGRHVGLAAEALALDTRVAMLCTPRGRRRLAVPAELGEALLGMPCLDAMEECYERLDAGTDAERWMARRFREGELRRVLPAEHTGLLSREDREQLEERFKVGAEKAPPWYENLLSATPTLEMGVDIGSLSSVLLCSVPPSQASYLQRIGRAGRRDGNAMVVTLADGSSPHDLEFYEQPLEMMAGEVTPPGIFLGAAEVLRRQLMAYCIDAWVASGIPEIAFPEKTGPALDAVQNRDTQRFPYTLLDFLQADDLGLLERFCGLLGDALSPRVRARLDDYMRGTPELPSLRMALLDTFEQLVKERAAYRKRAEDLKARLKPLQAAVQDESTEAQIAELKRERDKALELAREITGRDLLGTLTDAGLIPNYAFPEAGIELKSFIWRKRGEHEPGERGYVSLPAERYERPAASALSELAPENRFYANRRRVEIDQINMQLAQIEAWRLCPRCHHAESLSVSGDPHPACPRCGEPMWANVAQKRQLLRFRQAMASAEDAKSRIDDTSDDREPKFYVRQLLVDVEPGEVAIAWKLESERVAFGFEFIRKAVFRDINFGESGRSGEQFRVANQEQSRPGFRLCRHCGMVQQPPRGPAQEEDAPPQAHARDCIAHGSNDPEHLVDCLYLYREFQSEALRILVPYTRSGMDDQVRQSFMAALHLGLKRHFRGRVDHLRITTQEQPDADGGNRQYVLIYDSVPGGTGYLHQLLSEEAESLGEVLQTALDAVRSCACREQPDRDGCYRCVYQYRQGRAMKQVSRGTAEAVLTELVAGLGGLLRVPSIATLKINPNVDSVLEGQFLDALTRLSGVADANGRALPKLVMRKEVIDGVSGYLLDLGEQRWWVKPQMDLGVEQGVRAASRPDFLLEPVATADRKSRRSIAVFADGWTWHQHSLREDAAKRSALVASGRYWVWSVTWEDVCRALEGDSGADLDLLDELARHPASHPLVAQLARSLGVSALAPRENAVARLLRWLAAPAAEADARATKQAALAVARLAVDPNDKPGVAMANRAFETLRARLPEGAAEGCAGSMPCAGERLGPAQIHARLLPAWQKGRFDAGCGAVLLRPELAEDGQALRRAWRGWLQAYNTLQALPRHFLVEAAGLEHGDYAVLAPPAVVATVSGRTAPDAWDELMKSMLAELVEGVRALQARGVPAPDEISYELSDAQQCAVAEAELAWIDRRVVLLREHQAEYAVVWQSAGWRVVLAADEWVGTLEQLLGAQA
ncbi:MAG: DEAD/DEAH box helicase [Xanthomonadales bacterium]|jgi:DEAD/DEAH box helicase domain-containing protein|nr:DEAD/DEAH box helicase [Xanthomonadales bacterium]